MEQKTIGKRIMTLRKSRGMTQDQLAEKLGVTAQAVSKWENDVSCPDISLLPKLAEVFQVTTDSLLGMPEETELVERPVKASHSHEPFDPEADDDNDGFTFQWNVSSKGLPWFAVAVLLFAVAMLLNRTILSVLGHASVWELMWPSAVLSFGLCALWEKINLWSIGLTGLGAYFLLSNMGILFWSFQPRWNIILLLLLICWAVSMLLDHFRQKGTRHGKGKSAYEYSSKGGKISLEGSFGSKTFPVQEEVFRGGKADLSFGDYTLDLRNCGQVDPDCVLTTDVSFGSLHVLLPKNWKVQETSDRSFSSVTFQGTPSPDADQVLHMESDVSFGSLEISWEV